MTKAEDKTMEPVRCVLEMLGEREQERVADIKQRCLTSTQRSPDLRDLPWPPADLVPSDELSDLEHSALSTPYQAWAIAVRHRQRAFVFWTYVAAHTTQPQLQAASESMAREALHDADLLRRERRLAWRAERKVGIDAVEGRRISELSSAALLESLLLKEVVRWASPLAEAERDGLYAAAGTSAAAIAAAEFELPGAPASDTLEDLRQRAIRYAEQLTSIYLDEADRATDQAALDLAQDLASSAIKRLARLRALASAQRH